MKILLVNDDGVFAPGINALAKALKKQHDIVMVAPASERSGFSQSLTYLSEISVRRVAVAGNEDVEAYAVSGTPADCAKFGIRQIFGWKLDLVVSGINNGLNIGTDIYYSGTIGGATEAAMFGVPAIAVSQARSKDTDFTYAAEYTASFIRSSDISRFPRRTLININIPGEPEKGINGTRLTRQGILEYNEYYEKLSESDEGAVYRLRGNLDNSAESDTDYYAVLNRYISVTALKYDRTDSGCADILTEML